MVVIGKEKVRDELVYVPAKLYIRRIFVETVKCVSCGEDESRDANLSDIESCTIKSAAAAERWLRPIWLEMKRELLSSSVIHADETRVQVHNEPGRSNKTESKM